MASPVLPISAVQNLLPSPSPFPHLQSQVFSETSGFIRDVSSFVLPWKPFLMSSTDYFFNNVSSFILNVYRIGSSSFSTEEVIWVCRSLQRIAEHAQHTVEIGEFFHNVVIPRLLGLSLHAALESKYFNCPPFSTFLARSCNDVCNK